MSTLTQRIRGYPYKERLPGVGVLAVIFLGLLRTGLHFTPTEKIALGAIAFSGFFRIGGKPYFFICGFVVGALTDDMLPKLKGLLGL